MPYSRDKRSPTPKSETVSRVMSANKAKNTKPELKLRHQLWKEGIRGYRLHYKKIPGSPDLVFVSKKLAIFVNGCFWHRCPKCQHSTPKNNSEFWINKFEKNKERDRKKISDLESIGWKTIVIWECDLKTDLEWVIKIIKENLHPTIS